jgi:putative ABC transport system permease protein
MKELFGIPTFNIMLVLLAVLGAALVTALVIGVKNPTMFRMGLRNIPRRGLQSALLVAGLALATLITTAAFVTGDTVDHSLTSNSETLFGSSDIDITWNGERLFSRDAGATNPGEQAYADVSAVDQLESAFANDSDIRGFLPFLYELAAVTNPRSGIAVASAQLVGVDVERLESAGGVRLSNGSPAALADLAAGKVFVSERAAKDLGVRTGDLLAIHVNGEVHTVNVAGVVVDEVATGVLGMMFSSVPGGIMMSLPNLQDLYGLEAGTISNVTVALNGDSDVRIENAEVVAARIESYLGDHAADVFGTQAIESGLHPEVFSARAELIELGKANGNQFTTIFLVLGLFSMAAGIILIFMIFVMLAAERRAEMGMMRAVGAQRGHIVQSFVVEGLAYSLLAGVIGVVLGVGASLGMTVGLLKTVGGDYFSLIEPQVTPVSLVIGYSLGVVITFVTVVFASMKVSHVNIVAAVRQLPEEKRRERRRKVRWSMVALGVPMLAIPPLGAWLLFRKGLGLPWAWIITPLGLVTGVLLVMAGKSSGVLFPFALGLSLLPLSSAALASYYRAPARPLWTTVGALLAAYWLLPPATHDALFGEFTSDIEMFVLSGIMIVIGFTLMIVFNAPVLSRLMSGASRPRTGFVMAGLLLVATVASVGVAVAMGDNADGLGELFYLLAGLLLPVAALVIVAAKVPSAAPAVKMAIAYPLSNRFRTGMTIAMFSIVVFSLTVFSILLANIDAAFLGGDARGNLDIVGTAPSSEQVIDLQESASSGRSEDLVSVGLTTLPLSNQSVGTSDGAADAKPYPVIAGDETFFGALEPGLESLANGYESEAEVLAAMRSGGAYALVDSTVLDAAFNDSYEWAGGKSTVEDGRFEPFEVEVFNAATGASETVTVIGTLKVGLPASTVAGVYVNATTYRSLYGEPDYRRFYARVDDGADAESVAVDLESALATSGVEVDSVMVLLEALQAQNNAFTRMFQAFMTLGLVVGIAGLGVIAFRSVVERRQQIGMLRAIGFQRGTINLTFLLESGFVATMGILSGVVGGAILGRNLLTSETFTGGADIQFAMPWAEVLLFVGAAFVCSLLMTWWPSRGASQVPVAEALRYE